MKWIINQHQLQNWSSPKISSKTRPSTRISSKSEPSSSSVLKPVILLYSLRNWPSTSISCKSRYLPAWDAKPAKIKIIFLMLMSNYIFTIPENLDLERLLQIMYCTFSCCPIKCHLSQDAGSVSCMSTVFETGKCS